MTPEQQNIAIAKAIGQVWHHYQCEPDFTRDLNLCAKMEKTLRGTEEQYYNDTGWRKRWDEYQNYLMTHYQGSAPATFRCEAFLRVKGLWKDNP